MAAFAEHLLLHDIRSSVADELREMERIARDVADTAPDCVRDRMRLMLGAQGKRVRATMLLLLARSGGDRGDRGAKAAASIELLHLASLVHDDVIDQTGLRRGKETAHALWGNRMAVLLGDYALAKSLELVMDDPDWRVPKAISRAASLLVAGEMLELELSGKPIVLDQYREIIAGKTAALLEAATVCGSLIAGHDQAMVDRCGELGLHVGFGFQIIDDLLDFGIGAGDLGKAKYTDLRNGVTTLPTILYLESAPAEKAAAMRERLAAAVSDESAIPGIVAELESAGAFDRARALAEDHVDRACAIVDGLPESPSRKSLLRLIGAMTRRSF